MIKRLLKEKRVTRISKRTKNDKNIIKGLKTLQKGFTNELNKD